MNKKNLIIWSVFLLTVLVGFAVLGYYTLLNNSEPKNIPNGAIAPIEKMDPFIMDQNTYGEAILARDNVKCDSIDDENLKNTCYEVIIDLDFYYLAIEQYDIDICDNIKSDVRKESCKSMISGGVDYLKKEDPKYLANIYNQTHNSRAIEEYEEILESEPENLYYLALLSSAYAQQGLSEQEQGRDHLPYVEKALKTISIAQKIEPNNSDLYRVSAYAYEIQPDLPKAVELYSESIRLDPNNALAYAGRGHALNLQGILEIALADFRKAAELDVDNTEVFIYANLCRLCASNSDLMTEAIKNCEIVVNNEFSDTVFKSDAHQTVALMYSRVDKFIEAEEQLMEAQKINPNDPNIYLNLANLKYFDEKYTESQEYAEKAIALSPTKAGSYLALSKAMHKLGFFDNALEQANKALDLIDTDVSLMQPNKAAIRKEVHSTMSNIYRNSGDEVNAEKYNAKEVLLYNN